jgi:hypothetical protein
MSHKRMPWTSTSCEPECKLAALAQHVTFDCKARICCDWNNSSWYRLRASYARCIASPGSTCIRLCADYAFALAPGQTPLRDQYFIEKIVGLGENDGVQVGIDNHSVNATSITWGSQPLRANPHACR